MNLKIKNCCISYDECDLIDERVNYIFEEENEENKTKEEILNDLDYDFLNDEWDYFKECLNEDLSEINKSENYFKCKGRNMGWRNLDGFKIFSAKNSEELLKEILPNTSEFSLYVWKTKTQLIIKCFHHDSPTGEYYYIKPLNKQELKEELKCLN